MSNRAAFITCICCQKHGRHSGRGLIGTCYDRNRAHGTLDRYPRTLTPATPEPPTGVHGKRMYARYLQLAAIRPKPSVARIAFELGVSDRQVWRYAAIHRTQQQKEANTA
ncbi:hypothetical protein ABZ912_19825 [Nonomuraea angiospora]|uniref:hypothetical protein n=1 Tax=Nonomuraea angiospora TaxID=46172 RepID=UPI003405B871